MKNTKDSLEAGVRAESTNTSCTRLDGISLPFDLSVTP